MPKHLPIALSCFALLAGCGGSSTLTDGGSDSAAQQDGATHDGGGDAAVVHDLAGEDLAGADLAQPPADMTAVFTLTVENYLSWCTVSVMGGAADSTAATRTFTFAPNTVVQLNADKKNTTFEWKYWAGTAGDTSSTHDTAMSTTVTMTGDKTVQACCPFATGTMAHQDCPAP